MEKLLYILCECRQCLPPRVQQLIPLNKVFPLLDMQEHILFRLILLNKLPFCFLLVFILSVILSLKPFYYSVALFFFAAALVRWLLEKHVLFAPLIEEALFFYLLNKSFDHSFRGFIFSRCNFYVDWFCFLCHYLPI
jgi:hypothetical protein